MDESNKKDKWDKIGIGRNDEPTRFFSKEEIDALNEAVFTGKASDRNAKSDTEPVQQPKSKVKIEDVKPAEIKKLKAEQEKYEQPGQPRQDDHAAFDNTADISVPIQAKKKKSRAKKFGKYILLLIGFIIAIVAGFYLAFTVTNKAQSEMNAKAHDVQQLQQQAAQLDDQQQFLEKRRQELEAEKEELDKQKQELNADKSFIVSFIDKVTGKEDEQNAQSQELQAKIDKAQSMIDEVSAQMQDTDALKDSITQLKDAAEGKVSEHSSAIEGIKYHIQSFLNNFMH